MSALLQITALRKKYAAASEAAVDDLSFEVQHGEIYGLLGPNGAGKSTTVSILCQLLKADSGSVVFHGKKMGVAPQEIALLPTLTAAENLAYFGGLYQLNGSLLQTRAQDLLKQFGLSDKQHQRVETFSGGMKRRLNLAVALLNEPELLVLDEPTAGVDVQSRNMIAEMLQQLNSKGMSILYTSHHLEEAEKLCHRIGVIDHGKMIASGETRPLIQQHGVKQLEELFLKLTGRNIRD